MFKTFIANESGATAIEYGLIAALIAVVVIGAISQICTNLTASYTYIAIQLRYDAGRFAPMA